MEVTVGEPQDIRLLDSNLAEVLKSIIFFIANLSGTNFLRRGSFAVPDRPRSSPPESVTESLVARNRLSLTQK